WDNTLTDLGHPDLIGNRARLCQGVVLFNNFIDILANASIDPTGNNDNMGDIAALTDGSEQIRTHPAGAPYYIDFGGTCTVKTQSVCEANADGQYNDEHIERYYAAFWETLHQ